MQSCRIILDTNICLDLFVFHDSRCMELMQILKSRTAIALTRSDCRDEWLRVLMYPSLSLDNTVREKCTAEFDEMIVCTDIEKGDYTFLPVCHDQDDQKFLELAYDAKAAFLVTKDKALLKLAGKTRKRHLFQIIKPEQSHLILSAIKQK